MAHTNQGSTKGVGIQRRPPELPFEEAHSTVGPWMESEPGGVSPLEDLETDRFRHKETCAEHRLVGRCRLTAMEMVVE